ncbi:MAG: hypothetical protein FJ104_04250 [Deltaproteobacteria bacterium]|nr:hypothetical protein [Deltaproteobacteria bacterium]
MSLRPSAPGSSIGATRPPGESRALRARGPRVAAGPVVWLSLLLAGCGGRGVGAPPSVALEAAPGVAPGVVGAPETCADARDDNGNGLVDEGCGATQGGLSLSIAWASPTADVDLLVTDPGGELAEVGRVTQLGLLRERDCPGRRGACGGANLETVVAERVDVAGGTYRIRIRLESTGSEEPPVRVTLGGRVGALALAGEEIELQRAGDEVRRVVTVTGPRGVASPAMRPTEAPSGRPAPPDAAPRRLAR